MTTIEPKPRLTLAHALVAAFMDQTPKTRRYMRACALLVDGLPSELQHRTVRPLLRELCRDGYAYCTAPDTWWLTALGKATKEALEAVEAAAKEVRDAPQ